MRYIYQTKTHELFKLVDMKKENLTRQEMIRELIKPSAILTNQTKEVQSFCEPNSCTANCNGGNTLYCPSEEVDILF